MPSSSVLTASATTKLNARIRQLINDGCSDSQIVREIRREAKSPKCAWPDMSFSRIKKLIDAQMDKYETESESSAPTFESDEEDEEYVPPSEEESEDSEVDESEEDETEETEEDEENDETEAEEDEEAEIFDSEEVKELKQLIIYMDRKDSSEIDRLTITPRGDGLFDAEMAYDLKNSSSHPRRANFFEADMDEMLNYVRDIMCMVAVDELPFRSLEFAIPFYPNISLRPMTMGKKRVRNTVLTAMQQYLEHFAYA